jgi:cytochrome P450
VDKQGKKLTLIETVRFAALFLIPSYTQGLFTRRKFWVSFWTRVNVDRMAIALVSRLRIRHGKTFSLRIGRTTTVVLLDHNDIREVLANSPSVYVDAESKHTGMSHFQPEAVTISRGEEWKERRRYNETVLETGHGMHRYAEKFLDVVTHATSGMTEAAGGRLSWRHFDELFEQIASGVIFGLDPRSGRRLFDRLGKMMRESNRVFGLKKSRYFDAFYEDLWAELRSPQNGSLAALSVQTPHGDATKIANQIPHWMFAMRETLPVNTIRALALIVSHPDVEQRVREELMWSEELTPAVIEKLTYLGGCLQEAMRLWPTTPFIARSPVGGSEQILILNTFNHRDAEIDVSANVFSPQRWMDGTPQLPFNHLSSGPQVCAGKDLALFLGKAVLATLLRKHRFTLRKPSLDPKKPLPAMYNYFRASFQLQ